MDSADNTSPLLASLQMLAARGASTLVEKLSAKNEALLGDFGSDWFQLVRDAYEGTGGFRAATIAAQIGQWYGPGSYERGPLLAITRKTYLTQFPREEQLEFSRRVASSAYLNLVAPIVDTYSGHLAKRPAKRQTDSDSIRAWWDCTDDAGRKVDAWMSVGIQRAQLYGWAVALFDRDRDPRASRDTVQTRATWVSPEEILDWCVGDDGDLEWIRFGSVLTESDPITGDTVTRKTFTLWTEMEWTCATVATTDGHDVIERIDGDVHGLGRVPVAVLRWRPSLDPRALMGISQVSDVVPLALALFNTESQLTHHLANAVFAILAVQSDTPNALENTKLGVSNGMVYPTGCAAPSFIAAPESVSMQLQVRADQIIDAIYQAAKIERPKASAAGGDVASGIARTYDFQQTEAALQAFVGRIVAFEQECAAIVATWDAAPVSSDYESAKDIAEEIGRAVAEHTRIEYPTRFDVRGLQDELGAQFAVLTDAVRAQLPPVAVKHARETIALGLNPQATTAEEQTIRDECAEMYARDAAALTSPPAPTVATLADAHAAGHAEMAAAIEQLSPAADGALVAHPPAASTATE